MPLVRTATGSMVWQGPLERVPSRTGSIVSDRTPRPSEKPSIVEDWPAEGTRQAVPIASQKLRSQNIPSPYVRHEWPATRRVAEIPSVSGILEGPERTQHAQISVIGADFQGDFQPQAQSKVIPQRRRMSPQRRTNSITFPLIGQLRAQISKLRGQAVPSRGTGLVTGTARTGLARGRGTPLTEIQRAARHRSIYGLVGNIRAQLGR